jgi:hypothetical protein
MPIKRERAAPQASEPVQPPKRDGAAVPSAYLCPISNEIMRDPVVCADGVSYDRPSIELWFSGGGNSNPVTGEPLPNLNLVPNLNLRKLVDEFVRDRLQPKLDRLAVAAEAKVAKAAAEAKAAAQENAAAQKNAKYVNIVIKDQAGERTHLRMGRQTQCWQMIDAWCCRKSIDAEAVRFYF